MVKSCCMQSSVLIYVLGPGPVVTSASPGNHHVKFKIFMFLDEVLLERLPVQRNRLEHNPIILWTKWMVSVDFLRI